MKILSPLLRITQRLGPVGAVGLVFRKFAKKARYHAMLREVPKSDTPARLLPIKWNATFAADATIIERANNLLQDRNRIFSWDYSLRNVDRAWEYDPVEKKHWPRRHYTESHLHASDTPRDVKIVWEINRFVELPTLAQAALMTRDETFAAEAEKRMLSWIDENPFAQTINWASALEISIRLLSWTATLAILREAGFALDTNGTIARSIFHQAAYLAADLSTDKVVPTNHLIGEAAGLFVVASMWEFPAAEEYRVRARAILEREMFRQTYSDGVTREASSWYHQFVTDLFDLVERVASRVGQPMSEDVRAHLTKMKSYIAALTANASIVRYGDADDGRAIDIDEDWKAAIFGPASTVAAREQSVFPIARQVAFHVGPSFMFMRAGEFGMGGDGFSSHAHDDFLSPIAFLGGLPVLADPGTFVYNGNTAERAKYRGVEAHNSLVISDATGAVQKLNFGWQRVRPNAILLDAAKSDDSATLAGRFGEWPLHARQLELTSNRLRITDTFHHPPDAACQWWFHLDPIWLRQTKTETGYRFETVNGDTLEITLLGQFETESIEEYDYSPSYGVHARAMMLRLTANGPKGAYTIHMTLKRAA
ncbi:MAG: heparinase II/III family protein [Bacteroidota bacterium]|nr:heparinase II/III family protein [Bacteroidota bacterium]MDP4231787.1 heparinase II/III family protein [Bacteroidota bacterium]MDP4243522.1 heparinase II/III family protein [Bacteroidota bacterium]MDP4287124.1 heparinase II/III family protein [Bacteroidota bacterium]